ncbi:50S ribosomal protein L25 [Dictyobacter arantiisoli]|uniref:Large ribosomal subunit protein bL25 n=1 Tax=Dictyobacter arantiisoli TaxID=2014874 RepID=A0A5A5TE45_9CHLR|nr:50S ribosomal protein L25 [Dictyobacter arantiisoli]GCF09279.1 50S ribosomal protein L25 [Dictyobacter arantiisoli]
MAKQTVLEVAPRTVLGKGNNRLRKAGLIPANIYGHKQNSAPVQVDAVTFDRVRREHGLRNIISLHLPDAAAETVLVRHVQRDPVTGNIIHIDFSRVDVQEKLEVKIPLNFVGEAPGVKIQGGVLLHLVEALGVECSVSDIVDTLDVDISSLAEFDDVLHASDVKLPANYSLLTDPAEPIVKVSAPRLEVPEIVPAAETPVAAPAATTEEGK